MLLIDPSVGRLYRASWFVLAQVAFDVITAQCQVKPVRCRTGDGVVPECLAQSMLCHEPGSNQDEARQALLRASQMAHEQRQLKFAGSLNPVT